jgi:hypothetical protein
MRDAFRGFGIVAVVVSFLFFWQMAVDAAVVKVVVQNPGWMLLVDGRPFYIKGAGCGISRGSKGEDYLKMARDMGANCVRTWGTDQGNKAYLDKAGEYGLMVSAGIWMDWIDPAKKVSYKGDSQYKRDKWNETLDYVRRFKDHPAVLMWNVGNETMCFSQDEEEKIAFCEFLEKLIREIHAIDPAHPVIYTSAAFLEFPQLKKYVPSLDIVGSNTYGGMRSIQSMWELAGFDKPYVITEFGPYLPMYSPRDVNGRMVELGDYQKAAIYKHTMEQLLSFKGSNLGGFVFHLGETSQDSMTAWNINHESGKKQSYWVMYEFYKEQPAPFSAPRLGRLILSKQTDLKPGEVIDAEVEVKGQGDGYTYECCLSTAVEGVLQYYVNEYVDARVIGSGRKVRVQVPRENGVYRLYFFVRDDAGNVSAVSKTIGVGPVVKE